MLQLHQRTPSEICFREATTFLEASITKNCALVKRVLLFKFTRPNSSMIQLGYMTNKGSLESLGLGYIHLFGISL